MSSKPSFSLGRALSAALASLPAAWGGAWLVLILLWAAGSFGPIPAGLHAEFMHDGGSFVSLDALKGLLLAVVLAILKLMTQGALYRIALFGKSAKKEGLGIGGLQFRLPEIRLLLAGLIVGLFVVVIIAALFVVFAVSFDTAGMAHGYHSTLAAIHAMAARHQGADWIFIAYLIASWLFLIFVALKFSLMHAATIAERRIVTLNALGLSSGNVGKLFLGIILIVVPFIIVAGVSAHLFVPKMLLSHLAGHMPKVPPHLVLHVILQGLAVFVLLPLLTGFLSSAYKQIVELRAK